MLELLPCTGDGNPRGPARQTFHGPCTLLQGKGVGLGNSRDPQTASRVPGNSTRLWKPRTKSEFSESEVLPVKLIPYQEFELEKVPSKVKVLSKP